MSLDGQVILITGAGGGLGSTAALALAKQGAHIILLDKSIPKLEKIYDEIVAADAPTPTMYPFDLAGASEKQYGELATIIEDKYGSLQGLLHSATEFGGFTPLSIHKTKDWGDTLNVNLNAPFLLTRVLLPVLQKSTHASIVFTADAQAKQTPAYFGAYGVSKIALEALANILAAELESANKIRVNTLMPSLVNSPFRKKAYPAEDKQKLAPMTSLNALYCYLFSEESIGITGQTFDAHTFNHS